MSIDYYVKLLEKIQKAVEIAMPLLGQGPAMAALAMKILETIKTNPEDLNITEINAEMQALREMPMREENDA